MSDLNENQTNEQVQTAEVSQSNSAESASASPDQASFALHGTTAAGWLNVRNTMTADSRFPFMRQVWDSGNQEKSWWLLRKKRDILMWNFIRLWNFWSMAQTDTLHLHTLQSAHVMAHQQILQHW